MDLIESDPIFHHYPRPQQKSARGYCRAG